MRNNVPKRYKRVNDPRESKFPTAGFLGKLVVRQEDPTLAINDLYNIMLASTAMTFRVGSSRGRALLQFRTRCMIIFNPRSPPQTPSFYSAIHMF